ncbi:2964_t:CDS:2 [Entrophospora sp. SA101]|nr:2964_t:CDS:2 [Entrophospora sp. SA101]
MIDHAGSENAAANQKVIKSYYDFGKAVSECHNYYIREKKKWIPAAQRLVKEEIPQHLSLLCRIAMRQKIDRFDSGTYYAEGDTTSDFDTNSEPEPKSQPKNNNLFEGSAP